MKSQKFKAEILSGHKEAAAEVPFNPVVKWHIPAGQLWHGRRGYKVKGTLKGTAFESVIVPRARSFFLLIESDLLTSAKAAIGETVEIAVLPRTD
jgi:hypothetical protein